MLPGTNYIIRKEIVEKLGGWDEQALTEDSEMTVRLYLAGYHVQLVPASVSWEQEPESLRVWFKQRRRWVRGFNYVLKKHAAGLLRAKPHRIAFEILSSHLLYYFFFLAVVISDALLVLCLAGLININVPGPYSLVWILAYATFVLQLVIALSCEPGEDSPVNILLTIVMYFTYCQLWIPVVAAAFYDDFIIHRAIKWAKTERYQVGTA
jgi:cellulose synthase/poly-beta-1,6-N-acetylglucosamine synthase-like glycosyltransferase